MRITLADGRFGSVQFRDRNAPDVGFSTAAAAVAFFLAWPKSVRPRGQGNRWAGSMALLAATGRLSSLLDFSTPTVSRPARLQSYQ